MKPYKPNVIPIKIRLALLICLVILFAYMIADLITGYTYLPTKHGGLFLSGMPSLMLFCSAGALALACLLTIIDHYDKRPNEAVYDKLTWNCLKYGFYFFLAAPFTDLLEGLLLLANIDIFPSFHGIAAQYTFYTPELKKHVHYLDPILDRGLFIGLFGVASICVGLCIMKYFPRNTQKAVGIFISAGMLVLSSLWLTASIKDFLSGAVEGGGRRHQTYTVNAESEPAKFNAILLTNFSAGGVLWLVSMVAFVGLISNRIRPNEEC